jgi:hypothetical protein
MLLNRVHHVLLGLLAGFSGWILSDVLRFKLDEVLVFGLAVAAIVFFGAALAMLAELGPRATLPAAALLAVPAAALAVWGSMRFADVDAFLSSGHVILAMLVFGSLPVPFLMARLRGGRWGWLDYSALFTHSWNIVVRYASAWAFTGVVWGVLWLSANLLELVGVTVLLRALAMPLVAWGVTGAALGLGLAVVSELADLVSPYLLLRLFRLLLPVVLVVVAVFVLALPLRGLTQLFGELSAAGMLLVTAAGMVSLISVAVDQDDEDAVSGYVLPWSARALAVLLPVLAGLAAWAVALRVAQYGWTPGRVAAALGTGVSLGYGGLYALAALRGRGWAERIRRANLVMAGALIALAALWLTPALNAEAIATRSQIARFDAGQSGLAQLPLWELSRDWGKPGQTAFAMLQARASQPGQEALAARLAELAASRSPWELETQAPQDDEAAAANLGRATEVPVLPQGQPVPEALWQALGDDLRATVLKGCARPTAAGHPGCLLVLADLMDDFAGDEAVLIFDSGETTVIDSTLTLARDGDIWVRHGNALLVNTASFVPGAAIDAIRAAGVQVAPSGISALRAGEQRLVIRP